MLEALIVLLLLAAIVWVVGAPLRRGVTAAADDAEQAAREELEAAKEAKYREIRDAELDRGTGKLSDEDWRVVDRQLRAEAMEILRRLDALGAPAAPPPGPGD
ncbi:MAG TPA: hypothetical protein VHB30_10060 [Solirubrobacteraceae bacterium]|nr:hypothetical protein [Solirubrobacteraceae bacterium]